MDTITPYEAIKRMKDLTELGVSFEFSFVTYSTITKRTEGVKTVSKAMLRKSLRDNQSDLSHQLIGYVDLSQTNEPNRFFHLPLLLSFNNYQIKP